MNVVFLNFDENLLANLIIEAKKVTQNVYVSMDETELFRRKISNNGATLFFIYSDGGSLDISSKINLIKIMYKGCEIVIAGKTTDYHFIRNVFLSGANDYIVFNDTFGIKEYLEQFSNISNTRSARIQENLATALHENNKLRREHLFTDLVTANLTTICDRNRWIVDLKLNTHKNFLVMVVKLETKLSDENIPDYKEFIDIHLEILLEYFDEYKNLDLIYSKVDFVRQDNYIYCFLYNNMEDFDNTYQSYIGNFYNNTLEKYSQQTGYGFTMGVSGVYNDILETKDHLANAMTAFGMCFYNRQNNVYFFRPEMLESRDVEIEFDRFEAEINEAFEQNDKTSVFKKSSRFIHYLEEKRVSRKVVLDSFENIFFRLKFLVKKHRFVLNENQSQSEKTLMKTLERYVEFTQVSTIFLDYIENNLLPFDGEEIVNRNDAIDKAKKYMQKCYMEPLTLKLVSEYVFLNPNYFSELFKKVENRNFWDYLTEIRMVESKRLLLSSKQHINKIAYSVGYNEIVSFNRVFKKYYGNTPAQFRIENTKAE